MMAYATLRALFVTTSFCMLFISFPLLAAVTAEKTPSDVYIQVQLLADDVRELRKSNNITGAWPHVAVKPGYKPQHVFQKALEVLGKINSYRVNIANTGGITIPRFPGRDITPNEVFSVVVRLHQELALLVPEPGKKQKKQPQQQVPVVTLRSSSDVYAALSEVSIALEETLGLRSITPSEVYPRSLQIIERVRFLRRSQGLPLDLPQPPRSQGKLPNHALQSVHRLLAKIRQVEQNLWMKPVKLSEVPKRVITPSDVYDAMGVVMAELQGIKFRLGLEREFAEPEPQQGKTPDDVIQNTVWAVALLPEFKLGKPLQQYDRMALKKTPNHVFSITEHILKRLTRYRRLRGIQTPPRKAKVIRGLKPQHVYGKALEIMEKTNVLRQRQNLGPMAVPHYPLRTITPSEVFDLTQRLDNELALIHRQEEADIELWGTAVQVGEYEDKQPSDVFHNMQKISNLLDTILGSEGFTPNDVFREVNIIKQEVLLIADNLGQPIPETVWDVSALKPDTEPRDVLAKAQEALDLIVLAKRRAGMFGVRDVAVLPGEVVTPTEVFNQVRLIGTELTEFKVFLNIIATPELLPVQYGKTPAHVLQVLEGITAALRSLLHLDGAQR
ncbi:MAG: hypothetical protein L3J26_11625 [Candidatus Polarisedimenticolaceae bacterium]|nr:hypothetical protein [Candidatus Polarisedimenticolaceae bacterium]